MRAVFADSSPTDHGVIVRNTFLGNEVGLSLANYPSTVSDNFFVRNTGPGVTIDSSVVADVEQNRTNRNGDDGIEVHPSRCCSAVTLRANTAFSNEDLGVEAVAGTTDGGGNRAKHNGNPAQCIGVRCR